MIGELGDGPVRELVRTELGTTLFVEAGAGTGKTTSLVARIVELVVSGRTELREIAAITFTEAAAAELRVRLRQALIEHGSGARASHLARRALEQLEEASISTIHGFAQRILGEHPLEAGLPLRFEILDEIGSDLRFERNFSSFLDRLFDEGASRSLVGAALTIGISPRHLRQLARALDERWDRLPRQADPADSFRPAELAALVDESTAHLVDAIDGLDFADGCRDAEDGLAVLLAGLRTERERARRAGDWLDRLGWLAQFRPVRAARKGRRQAWTGCDIDEVREALGGVEELRAEALAATTDAIVFGLCARLAEESVGQAEERRREGRLRFHDLLVHARDLLLSRDDIRRMIFGRYSAILVDEFQDTDPLQLEIVLALSARHRGDPPEPGRLFFVGDPRQSIYRFRGADVGAYSAAQHDLVKGEVLRLVTNFRSVPGIVAWVNAVFGELLADGANGSEPGDALGAPLVAARSAEATGLLPVVVVGDAGACDERADARREREAGAIAATIRRALDEAWPVWERGGWRAANLGDVAILVPRRTGLAALEVALDDAGLSYRVESSTLVYSSIEVRELLACVAAVAPTGEDARIIAALRTAAFACGDDDLLAYRAAGGEWRLGARPPEGFGESPVVAGLAALARYSAEHHERGIVGTIEQIVADRNLLQLAALHPNCDESMRRIRFVVDEARAFVASGGSSIAELLDWMELQAQRGTRSVETMPLDPEYEAIRILTIHGAKGLEFPIVVLAELGSPPRSRNGSVSVLHRPTGGYEVRLGSGRQTSGFADLAASEYALEREEELRLAYVGATRARDHLVVLAQHRPAASEASRSLAEQIRDASTAVRQLWREGSEEWPASRLDLTYPSNPSGGGPGERPESYRAWRERRARLLARIERPASLAASLLEREDPPLAPVQPAIPSTRSHGLLGEEEPLPFRTRRGASAVGRAVHHVLQRVDLATGIGLESLARSAALAEAIPERTDEVALLARAALGAPVVVRASASDTFRRELPISVLVEGTVLEGIIDLCYFEGGGLTVVDYKTDAVADLSAVALSAERYRLQAGAYALALQSVLGRPVERVVFLFLAPPGGAREHEVIDLAGAVSEAREAIRAGSNSSGATL